MDPLATAVLAFWFGAAGTTATAAARAHWFTKDAAFDAAIANRFGDAVGIALAGGFGVWCGTPLGSLARVLLLDQFTRNVFRDTPRAFAGDARALATAEDAIERGFDRDLDQYQRWFMYLPFEHAEDAAVQRRALELFGTLSRETGDPVPLQWAQKHADVIFRFGRYPHRNAILGRPSTAEEAAFLETPGSRF